MRCPAHVSPAGVFSPAFISHDDVGVECVMADELPELHDFCRMLAGDEISGLSVIYDEVADMAPADLYLVERNGWPVPTPEAYPVALRFEPGQQPQPLSGEDLDYIDSCLQIIPDFVRRGVDPKTYEVETNGKRVKLRLSWTASTTP